MLLLSQESHWQASRLSSAAKWMYIIATIKSSFLSCFPVQHDVDSLCRPSPHPVRSGHPAPTMQSIRHDANRHHREVFGKKHEHGTFILASPRECIGLGARLFNAQPSDSDSSGCIILESSSLVSRSCSEDKVCSRTSRWWSSSSSSTT